MNSMEEKSKDNLDRTTKEPNIDKLREEFNKKSFNNEHHPKTSHKYKRFMEHSSNNFSSNKKYSRSSKAFSANKYNQKWGNIYKLEDKTKLDFFRKHPGYLYYKEIMSNIKSKQNIINKKRAFTGKDFNKRIKYGKINFSYNDKTAEKFPRIGKNIKKMKNNYVQNYIYNFNYNNYNHRHNHNYNYNINNININIRDKKNPYSISWISNLLNQNDYRLEVKEKFKGVPKLFTSNKKDENPKKVYNNNKLYVNNYISGEKTKKEEKENIEDKGEEKDKEPKEENVDKDDLDEEQQMQFYKNQKNFFKARKDIKEEPEDLEDDNDEGKDKEKVKERDKKENLDDKN